MKTIETTAHVGDDRKLTIQLPSDVVPGIHRVVVVVEGSVHPYCPAWTIDQWPVVEAALTDPNATFRREEIYGDNGR